MSIVTDTAPDFAHATWRAWKKKCRCDVCCEWRRQLDHEYYERNRERIKARVVEYGKNNPEKKRAWAAKTRAKEDPEVRKAKAHAAYKANPKKKQAYTNVWRAANPEKLRESARRSNSKRRAANPEAHRAESRARHHRLRKENPEHLRALSRRGAFIRRDRLSGYEPTQDDILFAEILRFDPCSYCGKSGGTVDHIVPIVGGGSGEWMNLTGACSRCNASKGPRSLLTHLARRAS